MPKSKRNKQISLTRTKKNPFEVKKRLIEEIRSCVDKYSSVYVFSVNDMRNNKLKDVREQWKHSRFFFGKNKVMGLALGRNSEEEYRMNLFQISNRLKGQCGLLFSNKSAKEVLKWFESYSESDFARSGNIAVYSVNLKEGPLPQFDHSMEPYLRQLGMPTVLQRGVVHLMKDFQVCKEGDVMTPEKAKILALLGHQMAEFKITIDCYWSNDGKFALVNQLNDMKENDAMQVDYQEEPVSVTSGFNGLHIEKPVNAVNKNNDEEESDDADEEQNEDIDPMIVDDNNEEDILDRSHDDKTANLAEENEIQSKNIIKNSVEEEIDVNKNDEISVKEHEVKNNTEDNIELEELNNSNVEELKISTEVNGSFSTKTHKENENLTENNADKEDALENDAGKEEAVENDQSEEDDLENDPDEEDAVESDPDEEDVLEKDADKEDSVKNDRGEEDAIGNDADEDEAVENNAPKEVISESSQEKRDIGTSSENDLNDKGEILKDNQDSEEVTEKDIVQTITEKNSKNETPKDKLPLRKRLLISRSTEKESMSVAEKCTKRKQDLTESNLPDASSKKTKTSKKVTMKEVASSPDEQSPVFRSLRNRTVKIRRKKAK